MKYLFFDLDDTILDFHKAEARAVRAALKHVGLTPTDEITARYSEINQRQWELLEQQRITREQLLVRRFELLYQELGVECSAQETQLCYEDMLSRGHDFLPGGLEVLKELDGKYDMYLVSNGTASVQDRRIREAGIGKFFRDIFISQRIGADKPRREFFDRCFAGIPGFDRTEAMIIGDSLSSDIRGGNEAGIHTCWYNPRGKVPTAQVQIDHQIRDLMELPVLLQRI